MTAPLPRNDRRWMPFAALVGGNTALALGPWAVRLADSGPVSAGFWRLALATPFLLLLALRTGERPFAIRRATIVAMIIAGVFFAADLAVWHLGIGMTRLGNATLFGNTGSLILMAWGFVVLHRLPRAGEWAALAAALLGVGILLGRSLEVSTHTLIGDLLCLLAGLFYAFYLIPLQRARTGVGSWGLLAWSSAAGLPLLAITAHAMGEPFWPRDWTPLIVLALTSQVLGQGLLIYALGHFRPLVIGLALLTQPALAGLAGWLVFGERLGVLDVAGMVLVASALVIARTVGVSSRRAGEAIP
jgi:drug/metabolite transporter (DMT)-like permease